MSTFSPELLEELRQIQKTYEGNSFGTSFKKIKELTEHLPLIEREQYQVFCGFCLYRILSLKSELNIPQELMDFHNELLYDVSELSPEEIRERWKQFGSDDFVSALKMVAQGNRNLMKIIRLIEMEPTGKGFLKMLREEGEDFLSTEPKFLHFLPLECFGNNLITNEEYEQVQLFHGQL